MTSERLMLLDTASLYFRAFFGMPDSIRAPDGTPVNAVRGLCDFIVRLVEEYRPSHLVCCWDNDWRPDWRVQLIPSYKAHRVAGSGDGIAQMSNSAETTAEESPDGLAVQVPLIREVLHALGIAVVGRDGYEADDVIGTLAERHARTSGSPASGMPVDVVTGDRDLFQLVDDERGIRVLYIARGVGKHERVDEAWIQNRFGVPAARYVDFAVLKGDPSDGLPGVSGVGDKTAAGLVHSYGDLEQILAAASDRQDGRRSPISAGIRSKLAAAIDYLAVAPTVVSVARDLDVGLELDDLRLPVAPAHPRIFAGLSERLGLGGSATRMLAVLAAQAD